MLWLVQRVFYGPESETALRPTPDLRFRELIILWPVAILTLIMGIAPSIWFNAIEQGVKPATHLVDTHLFDTHVIAERGAR
jgi:NADH-quinone oxidoreductase subunit M